MKLTIGIKALNESEHIEKVLQSALAAAAPWGGEVVLADSGSTDGTVEIANRYPVRIVQLTNFQDRSCGAGAQLAFQNALGEYFYLLDGDMVLDPGFLDEAIPLLDATPELAGVGGQVTEVNTEGHGFKIRAMAMAGRNWRSGPVDHLDCGGLYRAEAVRSVGYLADRNLHAFEEMELGARLRAGGWSLARIDRHAVDHYGHQQNGYHLLLRRMRSGYAGAVGEVLRGAVGRSHLPQVLGACTHIRNAAIVVVWWCLLLVALLGPWSWTAGVLAFLALVGVPLAALSWRRGSLNLGMYSLVSWNVTAIGLISGFFRHRVPAETPLNCTVLQDPETFSATAT
ncbi:glycosyltransferase family 2 protein [Pseudooceanicola sp. 502str34]|uniref:glycosyltransferase family 2 protein n=1 Tax=Maritimibacter alkaliphilus TaxID=404236 RepID=UPI001C983899|nr:glycosyltransferase [Maritimibacter alkaliphilus]MBY6090986.1 glycosyltransferase [Maritimibacter alkaliphilus]